MAFSSAVGHEQIPRNSATTVSPRRQFATLESREPGNISALAFNPDGTCLAVCGWNHIIQLWDLRLIRKELAAIKLDWELPQFADSEKYQASK